MKIPPRVFNVEFAALVGLLLVFNAPYLAATFVPFHDTLHTFFGFHFFYSNLFFHQQLAQWAPYDGYGVPVTFDQLALLSPLNYLVGLVGSLLRARDALMLFKLSVMLEQVVYLAGLYRLSLRLFSHRSTRILVCLAGIGTTVWYAQIQFNFRMFYLFPWIVECLMAFVAGRRPVWLWCAGLAGIAWLLGNQPYFVPVWLLEFSILGAILLWPVRRSWRCLVSPSWGNLVPLGFLIGLLVAYGVCLTEATAFTAIEATGRNTSTGKVLLSTYLFHGYTITPTNFSNFVLGWPTHLPSGTRHDCNIYLGLLSLSFFGWSLLYVRNRTFGAMAITGVALMVFSFANFFATFLYYTFPLITYYRYLGLVYGSVKMLFLFCAGFGWDRFWSVTGRVRSMGVALITMGAVFDCLMMVTPFRFREALRGFEWKEVFSATDSAGYVLFLVRLASYAVLLGIGVLAARALGARARRVHRRVPETTRSAPISVALLLGLFLDMGVYQLLVHIEAPQVPSDRVSSLHAVEVAPLPFQDQRTMEPQGERQRHALRLAQPNPQYQWGQQTYYSAYNFSQFDSCVSAFRQEWQVPGVRDLLAIARSEGTILPSYQRVLGCESPKLRLVPRAVFAKTTEEATRLIQQPLDAGEVVVIRGTSSVKWQGLPESRGAADETGTLSVTRFSANELIVETRVASEAGAWLVYADAFHPGWQAIVNGRRAPVEQANLAFKAVWLDKGPAEVRFVFRNGVEWFSSWIMAVFGVVSGFVLLALSLRCLLVSVGGDRAERVTA